MAQKQHDQFTIRVARSSDVHVIAQIAQASFAPYVHELSITPGPLVADYAACVEHDTVFVQEAQGVVVGFAVICEKTDGYWLETIALHPRYAGKGYGRILMERIETYIRPRATQYQLYTHVRMTRNIAWYTALGFKETGRSQQDGLHRVFFQKIL